MSVSPPPIQEPAEAIYERRLAAVHESFDQHHTYLVGYLNRMTHQWQDAENLAMELWQVVMLKFKEDQIGSLPLLRRKAYQLFIDYYRRKVRRGEFLSDEPPEVPVRPKREYSSTDEEEKALKARFWEQYPDIDLSPQQKDILWLHARYGYTYQEISEQTGVSHSTIGDWINLARKRLAEAINQQQGTQS